MQRIVDEIVEIPLSVCEILIENFELDSYELGFISPAELALEIANDKEEIREFSIKEFRDRMSNDDFNNPEKTSENLEQSRELLRAKIKDKKELLTVDLEYFLNHLVVTLSKRERLTYLNYTPFIQIFTHGVCEEIKRRQFSNEVWEKITRLFTCSLGLWGRMICLTYWADDDIADKTAYYVLEPDEEIEKEKEIPLDNRLWFSLNNVVQRLRPLGVTKEDIYYLCSNGEIECCVDILSLDRPVRRFEPNTNYRDKVTSLVKFERYFPLQIEDRRAIQSLGLRYVMSSKDTPLSRFLAITASSVSKILYQGYCTDWEAGINGFEAVFGDTSAEYNNGVESLESLKLSEDHLIVTAKELRRLETKYSDNKRMTDSDRLSNGAWKMMGVLLDLLKETNIYTSDNDIKAAILGKATEHKMKGMSQRNLDTFFKKANESKSER
tara:strand:- start:318 stop:1634 length:1317 start_codon:yes stop_codon:yes gene_type:complete